MELKGLAPTDDWGNRVANESLIDACQKARAGCSDLIQRVESEECVIVTLAPCHSSYYSTFDVQIDENGKVLDIDSYIVWPGVDANQEEVVEWLQGFLHGCLNKRSPHV